MKEIYRYFKIDQQTIAFLQYTIEAYEDLAVLRTVNPNEGIVELIIAPDFAKEMDEVLRGLSKEIQMEEIQVYIPSPTWDSLKVDGGDAHLKGKEI
ncbi:MAG: DUF4911 domain-containing protein [Deltaproteobacteria bacterium]|nr:DUF4911 domain-containing protein [Deltaproteobacteria bacterium]MBW2148366.1 DUF4911 domain-containing protein [Deltaproteobacteria bacterium]MBW2307396.1 DUF4911 domain-containing protein [Deltaproteobacteria bacterium]